MSWHPIETAPRDRLIVFAVAVFASPHRGGQFLRWDTWTDDPAADWQEENEIGWRMVDATLWSECPPAHYRMEPNS